MTVPRFNPAIVVAAWNRPQSLQRLLEMLSRSQFPAGTTLHLSIDRFQYDDVQRLAEAFEWAHGPKVVELHPVRLGLRQHMLHCGGLSLQYGSIILLEDDLGISPHAWSYVEAALEFYAEDTHVAGVSLYNYAVAESCLQPFQPWIDQWDNWFLQLPSSWGLSVTAAQWQSFVDWLVANQASMPDLPGYIAAWTSQSWKKLFAAYLIATGKYFVYPRVALTTNFEDFGATAKTRDLFQVPLLMGPREWRFGRMADSLAVYDAHFEPLPSSVKRIAPVLAGYDFTVDLLGQKDRAFRDRPWVLTRRKGGKAVMEFAGNAIPLELNLQLPGPGGALRLVSADVDLAPLDSLEMEFRYYAGAPRSAVHHLQDRRMPSMTVVLAASFVDTAGHALERLLAEPYPGLEVVAVTKAGDVPEPVWKAFRAGKLRLVEQEGDDFEGIVRAVGASSGLIVQILTEAVRLEAGYAERVARIFHQFPGLDWLSTLPSDDSNILVSRRMAVYRWDRDRFAEANPSQIERYLPAGLQMFRRSLWMAAAGKATTLAEQFRTMSRQALPQVSELVVAGGFRFPDPGLLAVWGKSRANRTRKYYHSHLWILWKHHQRLAAYKPVLRFDPTHGTWYEFPY